MQILTQGLHVQAVLYFWNDQLVFLSEGAACLRKRIFWSQGLFKDLTVVHGEEDVEEGLEETPSVTVRTKSFLALILGKAIQNCFNSTTCVVRDSKFLTRIPHLRHNVSFWYTMLYLLCTIDLTAGLIFSSIPKNLHKSNLSNLSKVFFLRGLYSKVNGNIC